MRLPYLAEQPWWKRVLIRHFGDPWVLNERTHFVVAFKFRGQAYNAAAVPIWRRSA